jgi:hypothetical protein
VIVETCILGNAEDCTPEEIRRHVRGAG